jgi:glutathione peroxidase
MFQKIEVNGPRRHPLYAFLTSARTEPDGPGDIQWNFAKFLVDRSGNLAARFSPSTPPVSEEIVGTVEKLLG